MEKFLKKINKKNVIKYENNMKKLLFFYLKELDSNINIEIIEKLDFIQIWPIIQNLANNNIEELKNINENNNFKLDLNNELDLIIENDINLLNKKRERSNEKIEENENEENENENENEENFESENNNNNNKLKDNFFSMEELNKFADEFDEIDNNLNNENKEKILKSAPNTISLKPRNFNKNENDEQNDSNSITNEDEEAELEALENSEESIKFEQFFDAPKKNNKNDFSENESDNENHIFNQIKLIEEKMLNKKEWNMKGEILSNERPKDSLLSNPMDFEVGLRPPPIPTNESTLNLEKIIKNRIKDDLFDDPIFKKNYNLNNNDNNDDYELNFSKNTKGLGKEIEDSYFGNDKIEEKKEEIKKEIDDLCLDLYKTFDVLTNLNFDPYLINHNNNNDIIKNIPAIQIEDVGNFVSDNKNNIAQTKYLINTKFIKEKNKVEMNKKELQKIHNKKKKKKKK